MNIRYPIYEGVYRILTIYAKISNNKISEDTDKLEERIKDKFRLVGVEQ